MRGANGTVRWGRSAPVRHRRGLGVERVEGWGPEPSPPGQPGGEAGSCPLPGMWFQRRLAAVIDLQND